MAQTEENVLQAMYEHEVKKNESNSHEYVVRGATVKCGGSKKTCALNLPKDHGEYTVDKRPLITINDVTADNVGFGTCDLTNEDCVPSLSKWSYTGGNMQIKDSNTQKDEYTVTRYSTATCTKGQYSATVRFENSGQVIPDYTDKSMEGAIDIVEDIKGNWKRLDDKKDFLGHIKISHSGVYNLGIYMSTVDYKLGGTVFLYRKAMGVSPTTMRYIGAYELFGHKNNLKFTDKQKVINAAIDIPFTYEIEVNWTIWVDLVLDKDIDYYVEIDYPIKDAFDYKIIGNMDVIPAESVGFAMWTIDPKHKSKHTFNYNDKIPYENDMKIKVSVLYLDQGYMYLLKNIITGQFFDEQHSAEAETIKNVKFFGITIIGILSTNLGTVLSFYDWISSMTDGIKSKIVKEINNRKGTEKNIQLTFSIKMGGNQKTTYESYHLEVTDWDSTKITGPKYLLGQFEILSTDPILIQAALLEEELKNTLE